MTPFTGSQISQELLSAYIDGEVNSQEQHLVEQALAIDPEIAWEVESLRYTVSLLGDLPTIALPQSFVLPEAMVADVVATRRAAQGQKTSQTASSLGDVWQSLLVFLGGGNLILRNAAVVAVVAFFVLLAGDALTGTPALPMPAAPPAIAQADVQREATEMAVMAEEIVAEEIVAEETVVEEMAAAKAMPAGQDPAQDDAPLIPDDAPMTLGAEPRAGVGGGGEGLGAGGGGEITAPQPLQAAPAALAQSASPAAEIQQITPAEVESANQDMVGAASISSTEMSTAPAEAVAEAVAESAPQAIAMSEAAADVTVEPAAEIAAAAAPAPASEAQVAVQSAPTPQPTDSPFAPLRLAQLGLALLALLLSGLWMRSR